MNKVLPLYHHYQNSDSSSPEDDLEYHDVEDNDDNHEDLVAFPPFSPRPNWPRWVQQTSSSAMMVSRMTPGVLIVDTNDDGAVDEMTVIIWFMSVKLVQHTEHSLTMTRTCQLHHM